MVIRPADTFSPGQPRRALESGPVLNVEIYGQRLGKQIG
jgi:hypothetical protein